MHDHIPDADYYHVAQDKDFRKAGEPLTEDQLLLRKQVLHQAENEPSSFDMGDWEQVKKRYDPFTDDLVCTTTRCIAGWAQYLVRGYVRQYTTREGLSCERDAIGLLGITEEEWGAEPCECGGNGCNDEGLFYLDDEDALARLRKLAGE